MIAFKSKWLPAIISGLLLTAAFPKVGISGLAWFALVPLFIVLRELNPKEAFRTGMIAGLAHYLTLLYWVVFTMRTYGYLPWWQCVSLLVLLSAYLALYMGLFALTLSRLCRKPGHLVMLAPVFWVALEYIRSFLLTGFPWGIVGYSQFNRLHIIQISDMFGVYGISFLVVLFNVAVYVLLLFVAQKKWREHPVHKRQALQAIVLPLILISLGLVYGNMRIGAMDDAMAGASSSRVAVVQGNIDQARKWDPAFQIGTTKKYVDLTLSAAAGQPDLVVWPETATPFYFEASPKLTRLVTDAVRQAGIHLLVGSPSVQGEPGSHAYYNSAYMVAPDGRATGRYDKVHLVPFGEYVPLKRLLSFVGKMVAQVGDFSAGEKGRTLAWGDDGPPIGVQICFEIIFPGLSRSLVKNGAGVLVNLTNDAWFGKSSAAYQHFSMGVFRAVENRRSLVRCANTGISGFVDPAGRIVARTALFEDAVVVHTVPALTETTIYTRIGDALPLACLVVLGLLMGRPMIQDRQVVPGAMLVKMPDRIKQWVSRLVDKRR
ncbi:MAG: apolipoprotein N-acyltransferase [Desulfosarcina sp.]|nr:apolipoprotein N-acyltransferase [Desulfosarcina sp.]MBC2742683.1 apolipoprotein N-acyltransferase [Desulfosarcina sp.]MBC2765593.1 apolipoprotein N-acyltransferase [Desulfosarcina sp.]